MKGRYFLVSIVSWSVYISVIQGAIPSAMVNHDSGWIDPDTPEEYYTRDIPDGAYSIGDPNAKNHTYNLIFSDEFNDTERTFVAGFDRKWTAIDIRDTSNLGQHYFLPQAVQIDKGNLIITSTKPKVKYRGASYVSGSVQTWNKFCYTGGYVEVRAILPGKWGIPGTWPAIWIMGNLGRAAYLGSQYGTWPWSFDTCAPYVDEGEGIIQKISACGNLTDPDVPDSYPEKYGLNPFQGRGATEIDVMEAQIQGKDQVAKISTSLQIRPGLHEDLRPASETLPRPGQWYEELKFGKFTLINSDYYGEEGLDSISALTQLNSDAYESYHLYQLDWSPGPNGYIRWWLDNNFLFEVPGEALNKWKGGIPPRPIPVEPSYLILSTAVSEKFSPPCEGQICDSIWPSNFTIDYVRLYQGNPNKYTSVGCNPVAYPTTEYIYTHPVDYGLPWYVGLRVDLAMIFSLALLNAGFCAWFMFSGSKHPRMSSSYFSSLCLTSAIYSLASVAALDTVTWIHATLACISGIVCGALCSLIPGPGLGALLGLYTGILLSELISIPAARLLTLGLIAIGVLGGGRVSIVKSNSSAVILISLFASSILGSVGLMISVSVWMGDVHLGAGLWNRVGALLGGYGYTNEPIVDSPNAWIVYVSLGLVTSISLIIQYCFAYQTSTIAKPAPKQISVSAGSAALTTERSPNLDKVNFFSASNLPLNMQKFKPIFKVAITVRRAYGFQEDSFRNQTEHIVMLLANCSRKHQNPYTTLHGLVFSNYNKWCQKLKISSLTWNESKSNSSGSTTSLSEEEISIDLCLFFFIWGEASNLRHSPEYLCFLFHKMKKEFPAVRHMRMDAGHFLDTVISPVYGVIKKEMSGKGDNNERKNYDDLNEFFWTKECLDYDYKYEVVNEAYSPGLMSLFPQNFAGTQESENKKRGGQFYASQQSTKNNLRNSSGRKSVAEALAEMHKTFPETRTWLSALRAFFRIFEFHVVSFHFLATLAFAIHAAENKNASSSDPTFLQGDLQVQIYEGAKIVSSTLITPYVLSIIRDGLNVLAVYSKGLSLAELTRHVSLTILHLLLTVVSLTVYWSAWSNGGNMWTTYYIVMVILHIPGGFNFILQFLPGVTNWLRRTQVQPIAIIRDFVNPLNRQYTGDNVLDPAASSIGYQCFWTLMLAWKLFFSFKFEIYPLVIPSLLLYSDHIENNVSIITTSALIFMNWFPFFLVYCVDITIWNSIWMAFTGTFVGFSLRIGEIRNFSRVRVSFSRAADAFNAKLIARGSKLGQEIAASLSIVSQYGSAIGHEVLQVVEMEQSADGSGFRSGDQTPLLSYARRKQTVDEVNAERRQKWRSFSIAWDKIIDVMRADDLISNHEKALLHFQHIEGYEREIYLPKFQLAGCFERFASYIADVCSLESASYDERFVADKILDMLRDDAMVDEALEEIWELANWVLLHLLGPCHANDVRFICSTFQSWAANGVFRAMDLKKIPTCGYAFADLVKSLTSNMSSWKANAKVIPLKKKPADYSLYQFPQSANGAHGRSVSYGIPKSSSTTGLSSLGGKVPRRSQGASVARIAALTNQAAGRQSQWNPSQSNEKSHAIPSAHIMQIREKLRTFLNSTKSMLKARTKAMQSDSSNVQSDPLYSESKGVSDRLTWILTQERGFLWDDDYTGEMLTLLAFEGHANTIVQHVHGLLTLQRTDAEPRSADARRRLLFFVNSLFMDMPLAPQLEEMKSYSVMTPFYGEDVLYSKADLESKQDGLDVHTLLFLQTVYKRDWENFLERVKPKKNIWKDADQAMELRLWASLRGQTLARTVQGMMYGESALRLLADIEGLPKSEIEDLIKMKFSYVVACQIYGRQKKNNDSKAKDIDFLLHRYPNLRVAYVDEVRVNYQKEQSYFTVLVKGTDRLNELEEVYRVRLPGNPILGEGKPENQNSAVVFTRGEHIQTIDMNQDGYIEEALKMRNLLEEFDLGVPGRPYTIVGLPEHIFTGSVSSLANYMALQETSFVTLTQRTMARPLRMRLHYGHPDIFNKLFFMSRGGISKASKGINLSEDIFAGYNNCLRGGSVAFPEYAKCGKGRDVGMQQIYKFEAKLAQGAAEQSLSRDVYRIAQRVDFFKLLSFYYNHVGFYLSMSLIIWTVYVLLYMNILRALLSLEGVGGREPVLLSQLQMMLGTIAFFTTAPLLATISVERGFKAALREIFILFATGGPLYFLFHIGTKWFYFGQTILAGGAKYRATGRGFVTKHSRFDELFRFYASSHLYSGVEIAAGLLLYGSYTIGRQYFAMTWSLWLVVASWLFSPIWFNPLAFNWGDVIEDCRVWVKWMRSDGGNPDQSWVAWFKSENEYFHNLRPWSKLCVAAKGALYAIVGISLLSASDPYHSIFTSDVLIPFAICISIAFVYTIAKVFLFTSSESESGLIRFIKFVVLCLTVAVLWLALVTVDGMIQCLVCILYFGAACGSWALILFGTNAKVVRTIYFMHDAVFGVLALTTICVLSAMYVPGKIQTWLLYNNALSRGVVIEDILRANSSRNDEREGEELTLLQMRSLIIEQNRIISNLQSVSSGLGLSGTGSDEDMRASQQRMNQLNNLDLSHNASDTILNTARNVSESELSSMQAYSQRLQTVMDQRAGPKLNAVVHPPSQASNTSNQMFNNTGNHHVKGRRSYSSLDDKEMANYANFKK